MNNIFDWREKAQFLLQCKRIWLPCSVLCRWSDDHPGCFAVCYTDACSSSDSSATFTIWLKRKNSCRLCKWVLTLLPAAFSSISFLFPPVQHKHAQRTRTPERKASGLWSSVPEWGLEWASGMSHLSNNMLSILSSIFLPLSLGHSGEWSIDPWTPSSRPFLPALWGGFWRSQAGHEIWSLLTLRASSYGGHLEGIPTRCLNYLGWFFSRTTSNLSGSPFPSRLNRANSLQRRYFGCSCSG